LLVLKFLQGKRRQPNGAVQRVLEIGRVATQTGECGRGRIAAERWDERGGAAKSPNRITHLLPPVNKKGGLSRARRPSLPYNQVRLLALKESQDRLGHSVRLHESCHRRLRQNLRLAQVGSFSRHIGVAD